MDLDENYKMPARKPKAKPRKAVTRGQPRKRKKPLEPPKQQGSFSDGEDILEPRKRQRVVSA